MFFSVLRLACLYPVLFFELGCPRTLKGSAWFFPLSVLSSRVAVS
jgi:hypothetical protein